MIIGSPLGFDPNPLALLAYHATGGASVWSEPWVAVFETGTFPLGTVPRRVLHLMRPPHYVHRRGDPETGITLAEVARGSTPRIREMVVCPQCLVTVQPAHAWRRRDPEPGA